MFTTLPKSEIARQKAAKLNELELALLDMHLLAAFTRPDSYLEFLEYIPVVKDGRVYEIHVVQIDVAIIVLVIAQSGRIGINDFQITSDLLSSKGDTASA